MQNVHGARGRAHTANLLRPVVQLLLLVLVGLVGVGSVWGQVDVLFQEDFEDETVGDAPANFIPAGTANPDWDDAITLLSGQTVVAGTNQIVNTALGGNSSNKYTLQVNTNGAYGLLGASFDPSSDRYVTIEYDIYIATGGPGTAFNPAGQVFYADGYEPLDGTATNTEIALAVAFDDDTNIGDANGGTNGEIYYQINQDNDLTTVEDGGNPPYNEATTGITWAQNTWHRFRVVADQVGQTVDIQVTNLSTGTVQSFSPVPYNTAAAGYVRKVWLALKAGYNAAAWPQIYYDNIYVYQSSTAPPSGGPTITVNTTDAGLVDGTAGSNPALDVDFYDDSDLTAIQYKIGSGGTWTDLTTNGTTTANVGGGGDTSYTTTVQIRDTDLTGLSPDGTYTIYYRATDDSANTTEAAATTTFTLDSTAPGTLTLDTPSAATVTSFSAVSGQVADAIAGVSANSVTFTLEGDANGDATLDSYWDGTAWQPLGTATALATTHAATADSATVTWTDSITLPTIVAGPTAAVDEGETMRITVSASDSLGNGPATTAAFDFVVDPGAPGISVNSFTEGPTSTNPALNVDFSDDVDLTSVEYQLNGGAWTPLTTDGSTAVNVSGGGDTSVPAPVSITNTDFGGLADGSHTVLFRAGDGTNTTTTSSPLTIKKDANGPTVTFSTPGSDPFSVFNAVSGSVSDATGGFGFSANALTFTLQRASDSQYWDGTAWAAGVTNLAALHSAATDDSTIAWGDNITMPTPVDAETYTIVASISDIAGNAGGGTFTGTYSQGAFTWSGTVSSDWDTAGNWAGGTVPPDDGSPVVVIPGTATTFPVLATSIDIDTLSVAAGASLDLAGQAVTLTTISNEGTLRAQGTEAVTINGNSGAAIVDFDTDSGEVVYDGNGVNNALPFGTSYFDLTVTPSTGGGSITFTDGTSVTVNGALTVGDTNGDTVTFTGGVAAPASTVRGTLAATNNDLTLGPLTLTGTTTLSPGSGAITAGTVSAAGVAFTIDGSGNDVFSGAMTAGSLIVEKGGGTVNLQGTVTSDLSVGSASAGGTFTLAGNLDLNGGVTVGNGGATTLDLATNAVTVNADGAFNLTNLDTLTAAGSTLILDGGAQALTAASTHSFGTLQKTDGGTLSVTGELHATATTIGATVQDGGAAAVLDFGNLTLDSDLTLDSNGGAISMGTIDGASHNLTIAAGTAAGTTTVTGAVSNLGTGTGAALTVENGVTGLVRFQSTVAGASGVFADTGTSLRFDNDVTLADGDTATSLDTVEFGGLTWDGFDGLTAGATTLSGGAVTLQSNGGAVNLGATDGAQALTVTAGAGNVDLAAVGGITPVASLTVTSSGTLTLTGNVSTDGGATANIDLSGSPTVELAGGPATIALDTESGNDQNAGNVIFATTGTIDDTDGSGIAINTAVTGATNGGDVTLGNVGVTTPPAQLTIDTTSGTGTAGTTTANQNWTVGASGVSVTGPLVYVPDPFTIDTSAAGGPVTLDAVDGDTGGTGKDLTIAAGAGAVSLGTVGTNAAADTVNAVSMTTTGGITLAGGVFTGDDGTNGGDVALNGDVTLAADLTIDTTDAGGGTDGAFATSAAATIDSDGTARALTVTAGAGAATFGGAVGGGAPLASLTTSNSGVLTLNGSVFTDGGDIDLSASTDIELATAAITLDTENGNDQNAGNVVLATAGNVDSAAGVGLTVNTAVTSADTAGDVTLGTIGAANPPAGLAVDATSGSGTAGTVSLNGDVTTTAGAIDLSTAPAVSVAAAVTLTTNTAGAQGAVDLGSTNAVAVTDTGTFGLTVNAAGPVTLDDYTADTLTISAATALDLYGDVQTTVGTADIDLSNVTDGDTVTLGANATVTTRNFTTTGETINGAFSLQITSTGTTDLQAVGNVTPLASLDVNATGTLTLNGSVFTDGGATANIDLSGSADVELAGGGTITLDTEAAGTATAGAVVLAAGGNVDAADGTALSIDTANTTGNGGAVTLGTIGTANAIGGLTIDTATGTATAAATTANGDITVGATGVSVTGALAYAPAALTIDTSAASGPVTLGAVDGDTVGTGKDLTIAAGAGAVSLGTVGTDAASDTVNAISVTTTGGITLNGGVFTGDDGTNGGDVALNGAVTLAVDLTIDTTDSAAGTDGTVGFGAAVDSDGTARALTVVSGTGAPTFSGGVGTTSALTSLDVTAAATATLNQVGAVGQEIGALTVTTDDVALGGSINANAATGVVAFYTTGGALTIGLGTGAGTFSLSAAELAQIASADRIIIGESGVQSADVAATGADLSNSGAGTGTNSLEVYTSADLVLAGAPAIQTDGRNVLLGGVDDASGTTTDILLTANASIDTENDSTGDAGSVFFSGDATRDLDGDGGGPWDLTVDASTPDGAGTGGDIDFGDIGQNNVLDILDARVTGGGTDGTISFNGAVSVTGQILLSSGARTDIAGTFTTSNANLDFSGTTLRLTGDTAINTGTGTFTAERIQLTEYELDITADEFDLTDTAHPGAIAVADDLGLGGTVEGDGGNVTIQPASANTTVGLGSGGVLELTTAELAAFSADIDSLTISSTGTGDIQVNAAAAVAPNTDLVPGAGPPAGVVRLGPATTLATTASLPLTITGDILVDGTASIDTTNGDTVNGGNLTVTGQVDGANSGGTDDLTIDAMFGTADGTGDGTVDLQGDVEGAAGAIGVTGGQDLEVFSMSGGTVDIQTATVIDTLTVDGVSIAPTGSISFTAGTTIAIDGPVSAPDVTLSGGAVDINAGITTTGANGFTSTGTTFDNTGGAIDTTTGAGDISISHSGAVTIGANLTSGLGAGAAVAIDSTAGSISVSAGAAIDTSAAAGGTVSLTAAGATSDVSISTGGSAGITTDAAGITITADDSVSIAAATTLSTGAGVAGDIVVTANNATTAGDGSDQVTMAADSLLNAGTGAVTITANGVSAGNVAVGDVRGATVNVSADQAAITEAGADAGADITAATVNLDAATGIGDGAPVELASATSIDADNTGTGNVALAHVAGAGATVNSLTTATGTIDFTQTGGNTLDVTSAVTSTSGTITITNAGATLTATSVSAGTAAAADGDVSLTTTGSGSVLVDAVSAGGDTVTVTSAAGIEESGTDPGADIAAGTIDLNAVTGIGNAAQLEISGTAVTLDSSAGGENIDVDVLTGGSDVALNSATIAVGAGTITLDVSGGGNLATGGNITTANGAIDVSVDSGNLDLSGDTVSAGGVSTISLDTTSSGDITLGTLDAGGDTVTINSVGDIDDDGAGTPDITTDVVNLDAVSGIGGTQPVELAAVTSVDVDNSGTGVVDVTNAATGAVTVNSLTNDTGAVDYAQTGGQTLDVTSASTTTSGTITITNAGANLTATSVSAGTGAAADGDVSLTTTGSGTVLLGSVSAAADTVSVSSAADVVEVPATDAAADVSAGSISLTAGTGGAGAVGTAVAGEELEIDLGSGSLSLTTAGVAGDIHIAETAGRIATSAISTVSTPGGSVTIVIENRDAGFDVDSGAAWPAGGSDDDITLSALNLTASAGDDDTLFAASSGIATTGIVTLDTVGAVSDAGGDTTTDVAAASLVGTSATGFGAAGDPIETTVANLDIQNSTSGGVVVAESDGLQVNRATTVNDVVTIASTTGDISVGSTATPAISAGTGTVTLTATGGAIDDAATDTLADIDADTVDLNASTGIGATEALELASAPTITADTTTGAVDLTHAADAGTTLSSASTATGTIDFAQTGGNTLDVTSAVTSTSGTITITNAGATLTATSVSAGTAAAADGDVSLTTTGSGSVLVDAVSAGGDTVTVTSAAGIEESGTDPGADIAAGTIDLNAVTGIGNAAQLEISGTAVTLDSSAGGENIDVDVLTGGSDVALNSATIAVGAGTITLDVSGGGNLATGGNITTANGAIDVSVDSGNLDLSGDTVSAGGVSTISLDTTTSGDITLGTLDAGGDTVTINSAGDIDDDGAGTPDITTDVVNLDAVSGIGGTQPVELAAVTSVDVDNSGTGVVDVTNAATGAVTVNSLTNDTGAVDYAQTGGQTLDVTSASTTTSGTITITNAGANLTATSVSAGTGAAADGDVSLTTTGSGTVLLGSVSAAADTVSVSSAAAISDNNGAANNVTALRWNATADSGIGSGDAIETTIGELNATNATSNTIDVTEADGFTVLQAANTNGDVTLISTTGNITIDSTGGGVSADVATGTATVTATAGTITATNATAANEVVAATINLNAVNGTIGAGNQLDVNAVTALNADTSTGNGTITVTDTAGDLPLGVVTTGAVGAGTVTLNAAAGSIADTNGATVNVTAGSTVLRALTDIGALASAADVTVALDANAIETQTAAVDVATTNAGSEAAIANSGAALDVTALGVGGANGGFVRIENDGNNLTVDTGASGAVLTNGAGEGLEGNDDIALVTTTSGTITVHDEGAVGVQDIATTGTVYLDAIGAIDDSQGATDLYIAAGTLYLNSDAATDTTARTAVTTLNSDLSGGSGALVINEDSGITLATIATANANVTVTDAGGDIIVGSVNAGSGTVALTASSGSIYDDGDAGVDITAATGTANLNANGAIGTGGNDLETTVANLVVNTSTGNAVMTETDDLVVSGASSVAGNLVLGLNAGNLTQSNTLAVTGTTQITTTGSITLNDAGNDFGGAVSTAGNPTTVTLRDANAIQLGGITTTGGGGGTAIDVATVNGGITVGGTLDASGAATAAVSLVAAGQDSDVTVNAAVTTDTADITITADDSVSIAAATTLSTGAGVAGDIVVTANNATTAGDSGDQVTMAADSVLEAGGAVATGVVTVTANGANAGSVALGDLRGSAVTVSADQAAITDAGAGATNVTTAGTFTADSASGIGTSVNPIETTIATLDAQVTGAGGVYVTETDDVTVTQAQTGNGDVTLVSSGGSLTVDTVVTDTTNDVVTLTAANAIVDGNGATNNVTAFRLNATADSGIGSGDAIETAVGELDLTNTTGNAIEVTEADAVTVTGIVQSGAGSVLVSAGATMTLTDDVTSVGGAITLSATTIDLDDTTDDALAISSGGGGGDVTLNAPVDAVGTTADSLTLTAGSGNVVIPSAVGGGARLGALTIASAANVAGNAGATADTGTITAATVTQTAGTGTSRFAQIDTNAAGGVDLNGAAFALNGGVTTTAGGPLTVTNSGTLTIADTTGPADTATVDINLDGAFTQDGAGGVSIAGEITTTADDAAFNGAVSLTGAVAMDTAAGIGDITFSSTVDGGQPLSLAAGSGNVAIVAAVGGGTRLGALTIASAANVAGDAGATADTGTITAATVTQTAGTGTSRFAQIDTNAAGGVDLNGAAFQLNGGVTTTAGGPLTVTNSGTLTIADTTGPADTATVDIDLDGAFTQDGAGGVSIAGEITTTADDVAFNGAVSLTGAVAMDTAVGIGDITFSSTVDGGQPLSLTAGGGNVAIVAAVGGGTRLGVLTIASAANVAGDAGATADTGTITAATVTQTAGTGTSRFAQIDTNAAGGVDLNGAAFALNGGVTTTAGGPLTVTNSGTLTIADTTGPADTATVDIDLDGAFTQDGAGGVSVAGDIATTNDAVSFAAPVTVFGDTGVDAGSATITFGNTISGTSGGEIEDLTINSAGDTGNVVFNGVIGVGQALEGNVDVVAATDVDLAGIEETGASAAGVSGTVSVAAAGTITLAGTADYRTAGAQDYRATGGSAIGAIMAQTGASTVAAGGNGITFEDLYIDANGVTITVPDGETVTANDIVVYRGTIALTTTPGNAGSGATVQTTASGGGDFVVFGPSYSADDTDRGASANEFAYPPADAGPGLAYTLGGSYTQATGAWGTAPNAAFTDLSGATITVGSGGTGDFYVNGADLPATANWTLNVQDNSAANPLANPPFGQPYAVAFYDDGVGVEYSQVTGGSISAAQPIGAGANNSAHRNNDYLDGGNNLVYVPDPDGSGPGTATPGWDFVPLTLVSAETVKDNWIRLTFNEPVENTAGLIETAVATGVAANGDPYFDTGGTAAAFDATGVDADDALPFSFTTTNTGIDLTTFYVRAPATRSWNTDATGSAASASGTGTDRTGASQTTVPNLSWLKGVFFDAGGHNPVINYTENATTTFAATTDEAGPVLYRVEYGRAAHDQPLTTPYDGHNYYHLFWSEPVSIGSDPGMQSGAATPSQNLRAEDTIGDSTGQGGDIVMSGADLLVDGFFRYDDPQGVGTGFNRGWRTGTAPANALYRRDTFSGGQFTNSDQELRIYLSGYNEDWTAPSTWGGSDLFPGWHTGVPDPKDATTVTVENNAQIVDDAGNQIDYQLAPVGGLTADPAGAAPDPGDTASPWLNAWDVDVPTFSSYTIADADPNVGTSFEIVTGVNATTQLIERFEFHILDNSALDLSNVSDANYFNTPQQPMVDGVWDPQALTDTGNVAYTTDLTHTDTRANEGVRDTTLAYPSDGLTETDAFALEQVGVTPLRTDVNQAFNTEVNNTLYGVTNVNVANDSYFRLQIDGTAGAHPWGLLTEMYVQYDATVARITDLAGNLLPSTGVPIRAIERTPPTIDLALAIAGESRIYMKFSEPVFGSADRTQTIAYDDFRIVDQSGTDITAPVSLDVISTSQAGVAAGGYEEVFLNLADPLSAADILRARIKPVDQAPIDGSSSIYDKAENVLPVADERRVSDVAIGLVEPVWATDSFGINDAGAGNFRTIRTFDGSETLSRSDITVQARVDASATSLPSSILYGFDIESDLTASGYWSPTALAGLVEVDETTDVREALPFETDAQLRTFMVPGDASGMNQADMLEFQFRLGPLNAARVTDPTDPRTVAPWKIGLGDGFIVQRNNVTILNNVIYPENGERTVLTYELSRPGMVSVIVFDLAGNVVRTIHRGRQGAGTFRYTWDGRNNSNQIVARGIYFIRVVAPGVDEYRKVIVAKD